MRRSFICVGGGAGGAAAVVLMLALSSAHASASGCGTAAQPTCPAPIPTVPSPTPASTPHVTPGATYVGRNGSRWTDFISVTADGSRLSGFSISFRRGRCGDGEPYFHAPQQSIIGGVLISPAGTVAYSFVDRHALFPALGGTIVHGIERLTLRIHFSAGRLTGVAHDVFRSRQLNCASGPVQFTGHPAGSPAAPFYNAHTATGWYRGVTSQSKGHGKGIRHADAYVYLPISTIPTIRIGWTAHCSNGLVLHRSTMLAQLPILRYRFTWHAFLATNTDSHGSYSTVDASLSGRLGISHKKRYVIAGAWHWSRSVHRAGVVLASCTTGPVRFTAYGPDRPA